MQSAAEPPPCETPNRNEKLSPGLTVTGASGRVPKKSDVVWLGVVDSAPPDLSRNWIPGYPAVLQLD